MFRSTNWSASNANGLRRVVPAPGQWTTTPRAPIDNALLQSFYSAFPNLIEPHTIQGYIDAQNQLRRSRDVDTALFTAVSSPTFVQQLTSLHFGSLALPHAPTPWPTGLSHALALIEGPPPDLTFRPTPQAHLRTTNETASPPISAQRRGFLHAQLVNRVLGASTSKPKSTELSLVPAAAHTNEMSHLTCQPVTLANPEDENKLSSLQVLLRHQIQAFAATEAHVTTHTRGRTKPVRLGQVGLRCRHCAHLPVIVHAKGSTYFPSTVQGFYQASQNMGTVHILNGTCSSMPSRLKAEFERLLAIKSSVSGAGRSYWTTTARQLGLVDTNQGIYFVNQVPDTAHIVAASLAYQGTPLLMQGKHPRQLETDVSVKRMKLSR